MKVKEIFGCLHLPVEQAFEGNEVFYLSTDSRQLNFPAETLFIAILTDRRDGHEFIHQVYHKGTRIFLVADNATLPDLKDACYIRVPDTVVALQTIASFHRKKMNIPVAGITGSNGKTIVKEWLFTLLQSDFTICKSPRSYNSQIGVPLSVWQLNARHTLGIFEAGISKPGEMNRLQQIIQPTIGIFTNLGSAHDDGFISRKQKLEEKWQLFASCEKVICCADQPEIAAIIKEKSQSVFTWGWNKSANLKILSLQKKERQAVLDIDMNGQAEQVYLPFTDEASIENAMHCLAAALYLGKPMAALKEKLPELEPLKMRLELKKGIHNCLLLNDSYSYDLSSLETALNYLHQQAGYAQRMAILSDLPFAASEDDYEKVSRLLEQKGVKVLIGVGQYMRTCKAAFESKGIQTIWVNDTDTLLEHFPFHLLEKSIVLVKGGRVFGFEKVVSALQQQQHETMLEIHLQALTHNLNQYKSIIDKGTKIMVMLKAFGYGSSDAELGRWLQHQGVDYLAVAYTDEGVSLRKSGVTLPIMVLNPERSSFETLVQDRLEPELYSIELLDAFREFADKNDLNAYPVHLKLDTGMHRLGFVPDESEAILQRLSKQNLLKVVSVFTHLVASENPDHDAFTIQQAVLFDGFCETLEKGLGSTFLKHAANSAAISRHPNLHYDMVRLGIGLFGVSKPAGEKLSLLPATFLFTTVAQIKDVKAGQSVGYGRHALLQKDSKIATVRIGYADGFSRRLGNGVGYMWWKGKRIPVVGNVCMDMTMLDVTNLPELAIGDRIEVFGEHISIQEIAALCQTIPYEIMTGISQRVKRVLLEE